MIFKAEIRNRFHLYTKNNRKVAKTKIINTDDTANKQRKKKASFLFGVKRIRSYFRILYLKKTINRERKGALQASK